MYKRIKASVCVCVSTSLFQVEGIPKILVFVRILCEKRPTELGNDFDPIGKPYQRSLEGKEYKRPKHNQNAESDAEAIALLVDISSNIDPVAPQSTRMDILSQWTTGMIFLLSARNFDGALIEVIDLSTRYVKDSAMSCSFGVRKKHVYVCFSEKTISHTLKNILQTTSL